jgi:hypothetical protein
MFLHPPAQRLIDMLVLLMPSATQLVRAGMTTQLGPLEGAQHLRGSLRIRIEIDLRNDPICC